jgi:hypothetical protein
MLINRSGAMVLPFLSIYLNQVKKAEYIKSYKNLGNDTDILALAEEGMTDYFTQLEHNK